MHRLAAVAGALVGLLFVVFGSNYFLNFIPMPPPPEGTPVAMFMGAFFGTGYLGLVKTLEVLGGLLVAFPRTRSLGLLILVPIIVNILAFHTFIMDGEGLLSPPLVLIVVLTAFLAWTRRRGLRALLADRG